MPKYVNCNLCGLDDTEQLYHFSLPWGRTVLVRCKRCGLIYVNPQPEEEELKEIYLSDQEPDNLFKDKATNTAHSILKRLEKYRTKGKILDIGAGFGFYLKAAKERDWKVYGVETSSAATRFAKENFGLDIFTGKLEEASFPNDFFDAVVMSHILEHLPDPKSTLKEAYRIMKKMGLLFVSVPNIGSLQAKLQGKNWQFLYPEYHLYQFTPRTLRRLLEETDFQILVVDTSILILTAERMKRIGIPVTPGVKRLFNKYLSLPRDFLRRFAGRIWGGEGLVLYARK